MFVNVILCLFWWVLAHENSTENETLMILRMGLLAFNHFLRQRGVLRLNCNIRILTNEEYDDWQPIEVDKNPTKLLHGIMGKNVEGV